MQHNLLGSYNPILIVLSYIIAALASFSAIELSSQARYGSASRRRGALTIAAVVLGSGVWAMHFVGMLAFSLPTHVAYSIPIVVISVVPVIITAGISLTMINRAGFSPLRLLLAGTILGAGIGAMHYTGMYAMQMQADLRWNFAVIGTSVIVAVLAATGALFILAQIIEEAEQDLVYSIIGAMVMGIAVTGLHYIAMQAAHFTGNNSMPNNALTVDISTVGAAAIAIIALALSIVAITFVRTSRAAAAKQADPNEAFLRAS